MRSMVFRTLLSAALASACLVGVAAAQPHVRDHRSDRMYDGPREAPPPPRIEQVKPRKGYVWVDGHWEWSNRQWTWVPGHWEKERRGQSWRPHRWEKQGDVWVRVEGGWQPVTSAPTYPPPPAPHEPVQYKRGYAWVPGYYKWVNGRYEWVPGRFEPGHAGERYEPGQWTLRNGVYVYNSGRWVKDAPTSPPPPEPREVPQSRPGYGWIPGYYKWANGRYEWVPGRLEPGHAGERFVPGQWTLRDGVYVYNSGYWVKDEPPRPSPPSPPPPPPSAGPTSPPPPPRSEPTPTPRPGFIWVRGHYEWRNSRYEWVPGHWERQRANQTWYDGRWERRGNVWVWIPGGWR